MSEPRSTAPPRSTVLRPRHDALGASFTDFGGWDMPVRYTSDLAEHRAVREAAGLFDISHMAEFLVTGMDAASFLDYALAGAISPMVTGRAKYSLVLAEDGGIVDDVIVYRLAEDRFLVIANAGNRDAVATAFAERTRRAPATVEDVSEQFSLLAVQGPQARAVLESTTAIGAIDPALGDLDSYAWAEASFQGKPLIIARTGYTGEDGFELLVPNRHAVDLWDALLAAGTPLGLVPAGLAARDTLRLEAGMPLYGHELSPDIRPAQAGLARAVATDKAVFVGQGALGPSPDSPVLVGLVSGGKRAGRAGYAVYDGGRLVGEITSGALSPTLGHPIALAYVTPDSAASGTALQIDVRGTRIPATVTAPRFYRRKK
jgi:aminomethyltransferase